MNELLINRSCHIFKLHQRVENKEKEETRLKERYVVLTDIYFLLFDPVPHSRNLGKLIFWGDIRQIKTNFKDPVELESEAHEFKWKDSETFIIELFFIRIHIKEFMENAAKKIRNLNDRFKAFQDDFCKPEENQRAFLDIDSLSALIRYKERLLKMYPSTSLSKDLIILYQRIIEHYSCEENDNYIYYLNKLQTIINNKTLLEELGKKYCDDDDADCEAIDGKNKLKRFDHSNHIFLMQNSL